MKLMKDINALIALLSEDNPFAPGTVLARRWAIETPELIRDLERLAKQVKYTPYQFIGREYKHLYGEFERQFRLATELIS